MSRLLMLDLFSGLGGASAAMVERGWDVVTVDVEAKFNPSVVADLREWSWTGRQPTLVWASPPCREFSDAYSAPNGPGSACPIQPDFALVLAALRIVLETRPQYWVIENVRGARRYLNIILGEPKRCGSFCLWGDYPIIDPAGANKKKYLLAPSPDRPSIRAKIPASIGLALCLTIEQHGSGHGMRE